MANSAVLKTLEHAWQALAPLETPMAVMGGLALSAWNYPRSTRDIDLLISISGHEPEELIDRLAAAGYRARHSPPVRRLNDMRLVQMDIEPPDAFVSVNIDLLLVDSVYHREAFERICPFRLTNSTGEMFVLSCEDLLLHKLIGGRMIDRSDAAAVLRANRDAIDVAYLKSWSERLKLDADLREVWREAYGDELR